MPREYEPKILARRSDVCVPVIVYHVDKEVGINSTTIASLEKEGIDKNASWTDIFNHFRNHFIRDLTLKTNATYGKLSTEFVDMGDNGHILISQRGRERVKVRMGSKYKVVRKTVFHLAVVRDITRTQIELTSADTGSISKTFNYWLTKEQFMERWHDTEGRRPFLSVRRNTPGLNKR